MIMTTTDVGFNDDRVWVNAGQCIRTGRYGHLGYGRKIDHEAERLCRRSRGIKIKNFLLFRLASI